MVSEAIREEQTRYQHRKPTSYSVQFRGVVLAKPTDLCKQVTDSTSDLSRRSIHEAAELISLHAKFPQLTHNLERTTN
jgi:hypothetical protein